MKCSVTYSSFTCNQTHPAQQNGFGSFSSMAIQPSLCYFCSLKSPGWWYNLQLQQNCINDSEIQSKNRIDLETSNSFTSKVAEKASACLTHQVSVADSISGGEMAPTDTEKLYKVEIIYLCF